MGEGLKLWNYHIKETRCLGCGALGYHNRRLKAFVMKWIRLRRGFKGLRYWFSQYYASKLRDFFLLCELTRSAILCSQKNVVVIVVAAAVVDDVFVLGFFSTQNQYPDLNNTSKGNGGWEQGRVQPHKPKYKYWFQHFGTIFFCRRGKQSANSFFNFAVQWSQTLSGVREASRSNWNQHWNNSKHLWGETPLQSVNRHLSVRVWPQYEVIH